MPSRRTLRPSVRKSVSPSCTYSIQASPAPAGTAGSTGSAGTAGSAGAASGRATSLTGGTATPVGRRSHPRSLPTKSRAAGASTASRARPVFTARFWQSGRMSELAASGPVVPTTPHPKLEELIAVLEHLRAPGGCAWDRDQTHASLVQYLVEETYELVDAIEAGDDAELVEELGDVLYQVVFHSDIAAEEGRFTLEDVAAHMTVKMVGRHPHVFGDAVADTPDAVMARWDELKRVEKPGRESVL